MTGLGSYPSDREILDRADRAEEDRLGWKRGSLCRLTPEEEALDAQCFHESYPDAPEFAWRHFRIRRIGTEEVQVFYAPSLSVAFDLARRGWGSAPLECLGVQA